MHAAIERLESKTFSRREATIGRYYQKRLARTIARPGAGSDPATYPVDPRWVFPNPSAPLPNTFPIVFVDGYVVPEEGWQSAIFEAHHDQPQTCVHNLTGEYIPVGTEIEVFQLRGPAATQTEYNGEWWCEWRQPVKQKILFRITSHADAEAEVLRVFGTGEVGPEVGDTVSLLFDDETWGANSGDFTQDGATGYATWEPSESNNGGLWSVDLVDQWCLLAIATLAEPMPGGVGPYSVTSFRPLTPWPFSLIPSALFSPESGGGYGGGVMNPLFHHGTNATWTTGSDGFSLGQYPANNLFGTGANEVILALDAQNQDYIVIDATKYACYLAGVPYLKADGSDYALKAVKVRAAFEISEEPTFAQWGTVTPIDTGWHWMI